MNKKILWKLGLLVVTIILYLVMSQYVDIPNKDDQGEKNSDYEEVIIYKNLVDSIATIGIGQKIVIDEDSSLDFIGVTADSRCPMNMKCIQEGSVSLSVKINNSSEVVDAIVMGPGKIQRVGKYQINILEVFPETHTREQITQEEYRITFEILDTTDKMNFIKTNNIKSGQLVTSPLHINGSARGYWFFEGSFPVSILDEQGTEVARGFAQAKGDWMTTEFVDFSTTLEFTNGGTNSDTGMIVLYKNNPSGIDTKNDELLIPITF